MFKIGDYMNEIQVKEIMIPISNYVTVQKEDSLVEVLQSLEQARKSDSEHAHRDAIVVDANGVFIGKVTMIDIFRTLEPNYKKVEQQQKKGMLTAEFVMKAAKDFNLWMEPTQTICERGSRLKVADVMHSPEKIEYIKETATLEKALHLYVMGIHQPLIVSNKDRKVTGVLRFGDIFEVVRQSLLNCDVSTT
jgi:CBS domain containing-hemolysin-like protein